MALDEKYYAAAHAELDRRRAYNESIRQKHRSEVIEKIPEYAVLEAQLSANAAEFIRSVMNKETADFERIKGENLAIQQQMRELLHAGGFPNGYLDEIHTCPICLDRGCKDGKWCGCFMKLVYAAASKDLNEQSPMKLSHFKDFDLSLYPDLPDPQFKANQRSLMADNLRICRDFSESFSGGERGLFMIGATGLGKTHLSLAIANRVIERGFSVIYGSVPELLRMLDNEQFGRSNGDTMPLMTGCDLLILDDLGAENRTDRNISMLYEIINARLNRSAALIVNTNFTAQEIKERYQDRIWSRLFSLEVLMFCGTDNRIKLARKK